MRLRLPLLLTMLVASVASAQTPECTCGATLDSLVSRLEANYAGYVLEVRGHRDAEYARHTRAMRTRARGTSGDACHLVLRDYLAWFRDGHLFVGQHPRFTAEDSARFAREAEMIDRSEAQVRAYLGRDPAKLDPIEGIWHAPEGYTLGIIRAPVRGRRDFAAIMLSDSVPNWRRGQVKAEFRRLRDGSYDVTLFDGAHAPEYTHTYERVQTGGAGIRRGLLLHMPPITWGKEFPLAPNQTGLIDPREPRAPTIRTAGTSTIVVSVPSHVPTYAGRLDTLVQQWRDRLLAADNLVIDVRGDEGGSSWMTNPLMPFLVTPSKRPSRYYVGGQTVILSSPDNVRYFDQMMSQGWVPKQLPARMRARPGELVPFADPDTTRGSDSSAAPAEPSDSATARPRRVAIVLDGSAVSAAEAFTMSAMRNEKVTLFGENSGGVLDYGTTTVVRFGCRPLGFIFGYPIMTQSDKLPAGGIRITGIAPDVRIPASEKDPIAFVVRYLEQR